jgi:hypothetical protein
MRGAGVDDAHLGPLRHLDRFARGIVMQAQDREIGRMQRFLAGSAILAAGIVQNDQVKLAAAPSRSAISSPWCLLHHR